MNIRYSTEEFCSICHDSYEESSGHDAVRLNCQHAFGRKCIIHWALENNTCPVCRLETIPAKLRGRESIFRRLENRTIFGLAPEYNFFVLLVGLLVIAAVAAICGACYIGLDHPLTLNFRLISQGAIIGLVLSVLIIPTPGQS